MLRRGDLALDREDLLPAIDQFRRRAKESQEGDGPWCELEAAWCHRRRSDCDVFHLASVYRFGVVPECRMQRRRNNAPISMDSHSGDTPSTPICHAHEENQLAMISEICVLTSSQTLADELRNTVTDEKICFEPAISAERAVKRACCGCSAAILVDDDPTEMTTAELLRRVRSTDRGRDALVVLMSAKAAEIDRVIAFELGADDFISKPISTRELSLRLCAVLRRHRDEPGRNQRLHVGPFILDPGREVAALEGKPLALTAVEFRLLEHLARNPGRVQERQVLLQRVWRWCDVNDERGSISRTVDTHVKRLREKLGPASDLVETIRGVGYRLRLAS